ncbi:LOW QUALITY PROTEIN: probable protein phosphatase 2C T23F11.1 [Penaeus monodon]|uniref:LOW QUALITY PROTEIN: probable protein phosphatase 2C T23F11.1 n=1 Tax=Penaeus monodon TaxID=6687 RepID=UPI0018A7BA82|nr:LOW QUALITY PROTEIN: probable protein phosphatase 2C T23F11.1 [Penaeus monodon]
MGQTLSEPVTQKETSRCENSWLRVGSSCMQGWRVNMEDAHTTILSLPDDPGTAFFAVYDGHGVHDAAIKIARCSGRLAQRAPSSIFMDFYRFGDNRLGTTGLRYRYPSPIYKNKVHWIRRVLVQRVSDAVQKRSHSSIQCTLVSAKDSSSLYGVLINLRMHTWMIIFSRTKLYGNVGDSRAIASVGGRVEELSNDHKPSLASEQRRITAAGGWVELNRVNGNLALSRALGDFVFKKNEEKGPEDQIVTANPDVEVRELTEEWEFIILACDGIWDVMTNQEVVDFVRLRLSQGMEPEDVCEDLMTRCLAPDCQMGGLGCDNMTVILICITHSGSWRELQEKCSRPSLALINQNHEEDSDADLQ